MQKNQTENYRKVLQTNHCFIADCLIVKHMSEGESPEKSREFERTFTALNGRENQQFVDVDIKQLSSIATMSRIK